MKRIIELVAMPRDAHELTTIARPTDNVCFGILAGTLSAVGFGLVSVVIHQAAATLPAAEITFGRAVIGLIALSPFAWCKLSILWRRQAVHVWLSASAGAVSVMCFGWNLQHTSVGLANMLFDLSLILILISGSLTGETTLATRGFIKMGAILLGTLIYWRGGELVLTGDVAAVGFLGAVAAAIAYTSLKKATSAVDPWLLLFAVCAISIPTSLFAGTTGWNLPTGTGVLSLFAIGLGSLASQYFLSLSFARLPLQLATALTPSCFVWSVIGAALIKGVPLSCESIAGVTIYGIGICALAAQASTDTAPAERRLASTSNGKRLLSSP